MPGQQLLVSFASPRRQHNLRYRQQQVRIEPGDGIRASSPARGGGKENRTRMSRPTTADTLVADEWVLDGSHYSQEEGGTSPTPASEGSDAKVWFRTGARTGNRKNRTVGYVGRIENDKANSFQA